MRNLITFLAAVLVAFLGLGWYLGWYSFQSVPASLGHQGFNVDINKVKIGHDIAAGVHEGEEKLQEVLDKNAATSAGVVKTAPPPVSPLQDPKKRIAP